LIFVEDVEGVTLDHLKHFTPDLMQRGVKCWQVGKQWWDLCGGCGRDDTYRIISNTSHPISCRGESSVGKWVKSGVIFVEDVEGVTLDHLRHFTPDLHAERSQVLAGE
jgi:hypothetical protein